MWENGFSMADVEGTDLLDRRSLALAGRSVALRGEAVFLIRDGLIPASDWELSTRNGRPVAYRLSIAEVGGGTTQTALAGEVLHLRIAADPAAPYYGQAPLKRSRSEEHTSELQSLMRISYAVFCLKKKKITKRSTQYSKKFTT